MDWTELSIAALRIVLAITIDVLAKIANVDDPVLTLDP
jgi:hypothetical protein